jgi:hypothetical protein
MYYQELELKELEISIAVRLSLHQSNFVVRSLEWSGATDIVDIANGLTVVGGLDALVLSGSSNAVAFETAHVRDATEIAIDTTTVAGTDLVTISSASNAHNNGASTIDTGAETGDVINDNGTNTFAGTTTLDASTINLNANITNVITGTTATVVNVNNSTAQIQVGVDVALAGATVNVAGGFTYAEAVSVTRNLSLVAVGAANANISAVTGPALTSSGATVNLTGFNATTSAATATILVTAGSLKLRQNGITGAGALVRSTAAVDASGNWWGTNVQDTIGGTLSANVDYSPFLNSGTDNAGATPGFQSSFNYTDLGGGTDTLDLAGALATPHTHNTSLLRINGVTRIDTGTGSDTVTVGSVGTAILNDTVFMALGSGNDLLCIGAFADSPAFNSASKFMFDGGAGDDTFNASPLSIAEYTGEPLGKKVKSKIMNFETLLINP